MEEETSNPTTAQQEECGKIPLACYLLENMQTWDLRGIRRANSTICQISCFLEMFLSLFRNRCSHFLGGFQHFPKRSIFPLQRAESAGLVAGYVRFSLSFIITIFVIQVSLQTLTSILTSNENIVKVRHLLKHYTVSWIRARDVTVLSVGHLTFSSGWSRW